MKNMLLVGCFLLFISSIGFAQTCKVATKSIDEKTMIGFREAIRGHLSEEFPDVKKDKKFSILEVYQYGAWHIFYVRQTMNEDWYLFYSAVPQKGKYLTVWSGVALKGENEEIKKWVLDNAKGIPDKFAKCFAALVVDGKMK